MKNSGSRLLVHLTLMTLGAVLMLVGIAWLMLLGLALVQLGTFLSAQKPRSGSLAVFLMSALSAIVFLILDLGHGEAFVQKTRPLWFWIGVVGAWGWANITEFLKWRKREASQGA